MQLRGSAAGQRGVGRAVREPVASGRTGPGERREGVHGRDGERVAGGAGSPGGGAGVFRGAAAAAVVVGVRGVDRAVGVRVGAAEVGGAAVGGGERPAVPAVWHTRTAGTSPAARQ